ncbi:MAG TPA: hypothetical protein VNN77_09605 [candidate division Zixibacteria bacterium]|nr:hypothetical protein [candidate division Zixibacteria bacterium]
MLRLAALRLFACLCSILPLALGGCSASRAPAELGRDEAAIAELRDRIVRLRGLSLRREIVGPPRAPIPAPPERAFEQEYGPVPPPVLSHAYRRIGLLPRGGDLARPLGDFERLRKIAAYDPGAGVLLLSPEAIRLGQAVAGEDVRSALAIPRGLALAHALQEQRFRWQDRLRVIFLEDRKLALRAVAAGSAVLTALAAAGRGETADRLRDAGLIAAELERLGARLPDLLRAKLVFPIREGTRFVSWAYAARGWSGVDALFERPPLSTAQVLHPERYFIRRQDPLRLVPSGLARRMGQSAAVDQTIGEALLRVPLRSALPAAEALEIASRWRGDTLRVYGHGPEAVTAWFTAWSDAEAARAFERAYRRSLEESRGLWFTGDADTQRAAAGGGRSAILRRKGAIVLLLDGAPEREADELSADALRDLEILQEPFPPEFDLARPALSRSPEAGSAPRPGRRGLR